MAYSQNNEEQYILEYFKGQESKIAFLEIGAYNPFKFSNTRALVELGASGTYVEPSPECFEEFVKEYKAIVSGIKICNNPLIYHCDKYNCETPKYEKYSYSNENGIILINAAIGNEWGKIKFYNSKGDAISSTNIEHKNKWEAGYDVKFDEIEVQMINMTSLLNEYGKNVSFLNLDVESTNIELFNLISDWFWEMLKMICIEHDGQQDYIASKLQPFGFKQIHINGENLILAK